MSTNKFRDIIIGIIMIAIPIPFLIETKISSNPIYLTPYIALLVMCISGIKVLYDGIKSYASNKDSSNVIARHSIKESLLAVIFLGISAFFLNKLGFYVTLFFIVIVIGTYIDRKNHGKFRLIKNIIFSIITLILTYVIFDMLLNLRVPTDVLFL